MTIVNTTMTMGTNSGAALTLFEGGGGVSDLLPTVVW